MAHNTTRITRTDISGGASAAKEPGHFEVRTGHPDAVFFSKKLTTFFSRRPQNTKAANAAEIVALSK